MNLDLGQEPPQTMQTTVTGNTQFRLRIYKMVVRELKGRFYRKKILLELNGISSNCSYALFIFACITCRKEVVLPVKGGTKKFFGI